MIGFLTWDQEDFYNADNALLIAPRRWGKTTALIEYIAQIIKKDEPVSYISIGKCKIFIEHPSHCNMRGVKIEDKCYIIIDEIFNIRMLANYYPLSIEQCIKQLKEAANNINYCEIEGLLTWSAGYLEKLYTNRNLDSI